MKKTICVTLMALSVLLLTISSPHALHNEAEETLLTKVLLEYDNPRWDTPHGVPNSESFYSFHTHGQFVIHEKGTLSVQGNQADGSYRGANVAHREGFDDSFKSHINRLKSHQPLVYNNFVISSYEKTSHRGIPHVVSQKPFKPSALDLGLKSILREVTPGGVIQVGAAFFTNLALHELGHKVVGDYVGATGTSLNFFEKRDGKFFLGHSSYKQIDEKSRLPFSMGGEVATDLTFEHALQSYRENPTIYNKSLLFFSGMDFLWYSLYAFYISDGHSHFDPIAISEQTGISRDMIFSIALAKTIVNAYRVYSGQDRIIPYFTVDSNSAFLNISMAF
jgi:hypothetical protein